MMAQMEAELQRHPDPDVLPQLILALRVGTYHYFSGPDLDYYDSDTEEDRTIRRRRHILWIQHRNTPAARDGRAPEPVPVPLPVPRVTIDFEGTAQVPRGDEVD